MKVLGIDPGINGAFVLTDGRMVETFLMPITVSGKEKAINFEAVRKYLSKTIKRHGSVSVFLERAIPFAMGSKAAFSYGRGFEALVIALTLSELSVTHVEPARWTKEMHEGISSDLKPKTRSLIAVKRLYPKLVESLPTRQKGALLDGPVDALLIAGYGLRRVVQTARRLARPESDDFF